MLDVDRGTETDVSTPFEGLDHLVTVTSAQYRPVQRRGEVRCREQHVITVPAGRSQRRIADRRRRDQERRIAHQFASVDDLVKGASPGPAEVDRVMGPVTVVGS